MTSLKVTFSLTIVYQLYYRIAFIFVFPLGEKYIHEQLLILVLLTMHNSGSFVLHIEF